MTTQHALRFDSAAVVLAGGSFNPAIFQPAWLGKQGLLGSSEGTSAEINIITHELANFRCEWLELEVTADKFQAATSDPTRFADLRDFVLGTFAILKHTPFRVMGLNRMTHTQLASTADWHALGDRLAPKGVWDKLLSGTPGIREDHTGLMGLTIRGGHADLQCKHVNVTVEGSRRFERGLYTHINIHYAREDDPHPASRLMEDLQTHWDAALSLADDIIRRLDQESKQQISGS